MNPQSRSSFYSQLNQNPSITLSSIQNIIKTQTGHHNRFKYCKQVIASAASCSSLTYTNNNQKTNNFKPQFKQQRNTYKITSDKDLQVIKPAYYYDKLKQFCNTKNCTCQYHYFKRSHPVSHHYYSKNHIPKMITSIRGNFGKFINIQDKQQYYNRKANNKENNKIIKNYKNQKNQKDEKNSQITRNQTAEFINRVKKQKQSIIRPSKVKNKIKEQLDCQNQQFQNFLKSHDMVILKKTPQLKENSSIKRMSPKQIFYFISQRLYYTDKQMEKQIKKIVQKVSQRQFYMRKFIYLKTRFQNNQQQSTSNKKISQNIKKNQSKFKPKKDQRDKHLFKKLKFLNKKNSENQSQLQKQDIDNLDNNQITQRQMYDMMKQLKKNKNISIQAIKKMINSNLAEYANNLQKIKVGIKQARKNGKKKQQLSNIINQFVQIMIKQFNSLNQKQHRKKGIYKKTKMLTEFKVKMQKQISQKNDDKLSINNEYQSLNLSHRSLFSNDLLNQTRSKIHSKISQLNNQNQKDQKKKSQFTINKTSNEISQSSKDMDAIILKNKNKNVNKLKMMKKAQFVLNSQIEDQQQGLLSQDQQKKKRLIAPKKCQTTAFPIKSQQSNQRQSTMKPRNGRRFSFFKKESDSIRQVIKKKTYIASIKEQIKKNKLVLIKIQNFLRDNDFQKAIIKDDDSILTMKRKVRVLKQFERVNRSSLQHISQQFKCYINLIEHRCYMGSLRKKKSVYDGRCQYQNIFMQEFNFREQIGIEYQQLFGKNLMFYCLKYYEDDSFEGQCWLHMQGKTSVNDSIIDKILPVNHIRSKTIKKKITFLEQDQQQDSLLQKGLSDQSLNYEGENQKLQNSKEELKKKITPIYGQHHIKSTSSSNLNNKNKFIYLKSNNKFNSFTFQGNSSIDVPRVKKCFKFAKQNYPVAFSMLFGNTNKNYKIQQIRRSSSQFQNLQNLIEKQQQKISQNQNNKGRFKSNIFLQQQ